MLHSPDPGCVVHQDDRPSGSVIQSHGHSDHWSGLQVLTERFPAAEVYAIAGVAELIRLRGSKTLERAKRLYGDRAATRVTVPSRILEEGVQEIDRVVYDFKKFEDGESEAQLRRFSPKLLIGLGALMSGARWIASSYTQTIWGLYATYGFLCGVGTGIVYIGIIGLMVKWFPDRRGLATGVVAAGYGFVYSEGERSNASPIRIYQRLGRNEKGRRSAAMRSKTILLLRLPGTENSEEARKFKTPTPDAFAASIADGISSGPATLITIKSTPRERAALLQRLQMIRRNGIGIRHCRYPPRSWYSLNQNFLTFAVQFRRQQTDTRDVAAGLGERSNQSLCNHVFGHADQRYGVSNVLECTQGKRRTGDDRVWRGFDQRCRKFAGMLGVGFEAIRNHDEILTFGEPVAAQFVKKCNRGR